MSGSMCRPRTWLACPTWGGVGRFAMGVFGGNKTPLKYPTTHDIGGGMSGMQMPQGGDSATP